MGVYTCVYLGLCVDARVFVCVSVIQKTGVMFAEDPDPIRISIRRVPIHQPIRKPTHEMIWRSVPIRAVKTRWRFRFKIMSFHVSVLMLFLIYRYQ